MRKKEILGSLPLVITSTAEFQVKEMPVAYSSSTVILKKVVDFVLSSKLVTYFHPDEQKPARLECIPCETKSKILIQSFCRLGDMCYILMPGFDNFILHVKSGIIRFVG